jgi:hypothetical protein
MHHRLNFISGVVMLVVAGTLVFVVTQGDEPARESAGARSSSKAAARKAGTRDSQRLSPIAGEGMHPTPAGGRSTSALQSSTTSALRKDLKVEVDAAHPRRQELEQRAQLVESFALRRLGVLTEQLDLTAEQQARIFPVLVRGSQSYDPVMRIVSGSQARSAPTGGEIASEAPLDKPQEQELVQKELDTEQSDELIERTIGDLLIWEEIIGGLTRQLDQAVPGEIAEVVPERGMTALPGQEPQQPVEEVPAEETDSTTPPDSHGGRNLFEQLAPP